METSDVQTFPSEDECDPSLDEHFIRPTRSLKAEFFASVKSIYNGLFCSTKSNELSEKQGKRSRSASPKTAKRTKLSSHFSLPSEEINSEISSGDNFRDDNSDDSNSSYRTAASDAESDLSFCSASDICVPLAKSLGDESSSIKQVGKAPWLVRKFCDQINNETEQESLGSLGVSDDRVFEEGDSASNLDSDRLNFSGELAYEMKPFGQRSDVIVEKSDIQFNNGMVLEANSYSGNEEKFQNIVKNSGHKNCPGNQEKTRHVFESLNDSDYFQFGPKKFPTVGGRISLSPKRELNSKVNDELLISALAPGFPTCSNSQNTCFPPLLVQTQTDSPHKKSYCFARNEVKNQGEKIADVCLASHQQIGADPKLDGTDFTSFRACEVGDYIEEQSHFERFRILDSSKASLSYGAEEIKNLGSNYGQKLETSPMQSFGSPNLSETEAKEADVDVAEGLSTKLPDAVVGLISSETKNGSDNDENYKRIHGLLGGDYQLGEQSISEMSKSFRNLSKSEVTGNKFVKTAEEIGDGFLTASKNNFKDEDSFHSENMTTEELDEVCSAASKSGMRYNTGSENPIRKKMKILQEITGDIDSPLGKMDNCVLECFGFHDSNLNPSVNMQNYSEEGKDLVASSKTNCDIIGDLAQQSTYCSEKIVNEPLLNSSKLVHTVINPSASNDVQSPDKLAEKQEILNYLGLRSAEPKPEFPCKLVPELNSTEIKSSCFSDNKSDINSDEKKASLKNEPGREKEKCQKSSKSSQNTKSEIFETWQVKPTDINSTLHTEGKIVPPLILKRSLAPYSEPSQSLSKIDVTNEKCMDQSNQDRETNSKIVSNLHNNSSKNTLENETKALNLNSSVFSLPPKDNVKRVFEVLSPMNRSAPLIRARDRPQRIHSPSSYKTDVQKKIFEEANSAIQSISLSLKDNHLESKISNTSEFCTKSKKSVSCLGEESHPEKSEAELDRTSPVEPDVLSVSFLEEESSPEKCEAELKAEFDSSPVEPDVISVSCEPSFLEEESRPEKSEAN
ncbi:hypothetical protein AVEN_105552-1 [Araneus ventricosus]|uniref:Uncharacterized protein n=1 Tax=Araneus ventricosus TaxID=182803 RepID=A0A4Y2GSV4_ARAVE|nr:hypothetical protein AVEN_105552-1 [Araneus ventricosus]